MYKNAVIIAIIIFGLAATASAIEKVERITDREIIESLTELKTEIRALNQRMNDMRTEINYPAQAARYRD